LLQLLRQRGDAGRSFVVGGAQVHQYADVSHALALLRAGGKRPPGQAAA
jgi:hypothetical protein